MKISSKFATIAMFVLIFSATIPASFADLHEGFDGATAGYAGSSLPTPWTFASTNPTCWSVPTNAPPTGVTPLGNNYQPAAEATTSPPQAFEFNFNANCYGLSTSASITVPLNMTGSTLFLSWWQSMIAIEAPASTPATNDHLPADTVILTLLVDGVVEYTNDTSGLYETCNAPTYQCVCPTTPPVGCWNQVSNSAGLPEIPGSIHTMTLMMSVVPYTDAYSFSFAIDTIMSQNSNPVITGNNFVVMNYATHNWWDFDTTNDTQLALNYTVPDIPPPCQSGGSGFTLGPGIPPPTVKGTGNNCIISNVYTPDIIVPDLSLISLATISMPNQYSRSIIPCLDPLHGIVVVNSLTCTKQRMFLDLNNATGLSKYTITVNDLTSTVSKSANAFGSAGVKMFIYRGTTLITSGYTDIQSSFNAALIPDTYQVILMNAAGDEFTTSLNAGPTTALSIQVSVAGFVGSNNQNQLNLFASLDCNGTNVVATYYDVKAETTQVTFHLDLYNISGIYVISSQTVSMAGAYSSATFAINQTIASEYLVNTNSTRTDGTFPVLGPVAPASGLAVPGCSINLSFPKTPIFPNSVLGLSEVLPTPAAWLNLLGLFILFITAALFGARAASLGTIFVVVEFVVLVWAGWLPLTSMSFYISFFMVISILVFLTQKARKRY